jgi:hypothetical protein
MAYSLQLVPKKTILALLLFFTEKVLFCSLSILLIWVNNILFNPS